MTLARPTRDELLARVALDVEAEVQNGASLIPGTLERALAKANADLAHTQHGHLAHNARSIMVDVADDADLQRWAVIYLGEKARKQPARASFLVTFTGTVANAPIDKGTRVVREDGVVFETIASTALPSLPPFEVDATVRAVDPGEAGNTLPGTVLTMETAVANIDAAVTVAGDGDDLIGGGTDLERIEDLRARLLQHLRNPPQGGGSGDYVRWATEVPFVTRAWELVHTLGPSSVLVLVVQDTFDAEGAFEETLLPAQAQLDEVLDYIAARCPVVIGQPNPKGQRKLSVQSPEELPLNPVIEMTPDTPEIRAAVLRNLQDLCFHHGGPLRMITISHIRELISLAGATSHDLLAPVANVTATATQLHTVGAITFDP